jgi:transposase
MVMFNETQALPEDPAELRMAAEGLISLVKSQALRIAKLEHQLAGLRRHRFGSTSESLDQLQLRLEDDEIAAAQTDKAVPPSDPGQTHVISRLKAALKRGASAYRGRRYRG